MVIEQIIEFESRVICPPVVHVILKLVIFMTKQRSARKIFEGILPLNLFQKAMYLASLHLDQVNYKIYPKNARFYPKIASKGKTEQLNFFNCVSNLNNLVLSNGFKNLQNVIYCKRH